MLTWHASGNLTPKHEKTSTGVLGLTLLNVTRKKKIGAPQLACNHSRERISCQLLSHLPWHYILT